MAVETVRLGAAIRHAEQRHARLEDALLKWSQVFQLAGWGAAVVDPTDRRIDTVNPAFARMHGYGKPEELTGRLDLTLVHVLEHPPDGWTGESGYIDAGVLSRHLPPGFKRFQYFICGPDPMMDAAETALIELDVPPERVHTERFDMV